MKTPQTLNDATQALKASTDTVTGAAREFFFAGLGVVALLQEEAEKTIDRLIHEGERVERGRPKTLTAQAVQEAEGEAAEVRAEVEKAGQKVRAASEKAEAFGAAFEKQLADSIAATLRRMNVPTREDVESLKRSVDRLNRKTESLRAS